MRKAGIEAVRKHPGAYASGVSETVWQQLSKSYFRAASTSATSSTPPAKVEVKGQSLPAPTEGQPIPAGQNVWISRPDNSIRDVWTSATEHHFVFEKPSQRPRFDQIIRERDRLFAALPDRHGDSQLALRLDQLSRWFPRPIIWIVLGLLGLVWRRPRGAATLVALGLAAMLVIVFNALGLFADPHFALPVAPAFVLLAAGALFGPRPADP
jgi:hypothetical protein